MINLQNTTTGDIWAFQEGDDILGLMRDGIIPNTLSFSIVERQTKDHVWNEAAQNWDAPSSTVAAPVKLSLFQRIKSLIGVA